MGPGVHTHWRDCKEWESYGIKLGTTSNEVAKLYDAALTQFAGFYDEPSVGGLRATIGKLLQTEPQFVMGHVLANGLELLGTEKTDPEFKLRLAKMVEASERSDVNGWEKKHANAVSYLGQGNWDQAEAIWDDILIDNPLDMLALKFSSLYYFYRGYQPQLRDSVARVIPYWKDTMPLYGYLMGMHAYGLEENHFYDQAEKAARKGLEINQYDTWSTHALAHVLEMTGRPKEGISFLSSTVQDWEQSGVLAGHNYWHWALYHIENGEYQGAFDIFDSQTAERFNKIGGMIHLLDACSLLWRLEMEGQSVGDRWNDIFESVKSHSEDHVLSLNDVHIIMGCLGSKQKDITDKMMQTMEQCIRVGSGTQRDILESIGRPVCQAIVAYGEGNFAKAVDLMFPIRYKIKNIGGSNAQRDIFNLFLLSAAIKSPSKHHNKLARQLAVERQSLKDDSPLNDRWMAKAMAAHAD